MVSLMRRRRELMQAASAAQLEWDYEWYPTMGLLENQPDAALDRNSTGTGGTSIAGATWDAIQIDPTRISAYINASGAWVSSADSYSVCIPVAIGKPCRIRWTTTTSGTVGTIYRYGFSTSNTASGKTLTQWVRTSPQSTQDVTLIPDRSYLVIQMSASYAEGNVTSGYLVVEELASAVGEQIWSGDSSYIQPYFTSDNAMRTMATGYGTLEVVCYGVWNNGTGSNRRNLRITAAKDSTNRVTIYPFGGKWRLLTGSGDDNDPICDAADNTEYTIRIVLKDTLADIFINGTKVASDISTTQFYAGTSNGVMHQNGGGSAYYGVVKSLKIKQGA